MGWLIDNASTVIISVVILAAAVGVIVKMQKDRKRGRTSCGCSCGDCPYKNKCQNSERKTK